LVSVVIAIVGLVVTVAGVFARSSVESAVLIGLGFLLMAAGVVGAVQPSGLG